MQIKPNKNFRACPKVNPEVIDAILADIKDHSTKKHAAEANGSEVLVPMVKCWRRRCRWCWVRWSAAAAVAAAASGGGSGGGGGGGSGTGSSGSGGGGDGGGMVAAAAASVTVAPMNI